MRTLILKTTQLLVAFSTTSSAQILDSAFGNSGKVYTTFGNNSVYFSALALQSDGKIYAVGGKSNSAFSNNGIYIFKYNTDGSLDTSYNPNSINGLPGSKEIGYGSNYEFCFTSILQNDNKLIVAGSSNGNFGITRLRETGNYDSTFSSDGRTIINFGAGNGSQIDKVLLQADGKILGIGRAYSGIDYDYGVARLNSDGSLDSTFGTSGKAIVAIGPFNDFGLDAVLQPDGKILIVGNSKTNLGVDNFSIIRLNTNGTLDNTFGTNGKAIFQIGSTACVANAIALRNDGKILVAGASDGDFAMFRLNANGVIDVSFGNSGFVTTDFGNSSDKAYAISIKSGAKIILAGHGYEAGNPGLEHFAIAQYDANGNLDANFSSDGKLIFLMESNSAIYDMLIQSDGKLLFGGNSINNATALTRFALLRLNDLPTTVSLQELKNEAFGNIYPNPTNSKLNVSINNEYGEFTITIRNIFAQVVFVNQYFSQSRNTNVELDFNDLPSGNYNLKINGQHLSKMYVLSKF